MKLQFLVTVDVPDNMGTQAVTNYIREAINDHAGYYEGPLFCYEFRARVRRLKDETQFVPKVRRKRKES